MIKVFITLNIGETTDEIVSKIIKEKWALEVTQDEIILHSESENGELQCLKQSEISFITKALLYSELEEWVLKYFGDKISTFYSIPVVNLDKNRSTLVRSTLRKA